MRFSARMEPASGTNHLPEGASYPAFTSLRKPQELSTAGDYSFGGPIDGCLQMPRAQMACHTNGRTLYENPAEVQHWVATASDGATEYPNGPSAFPDLYGARTEAQLPQTNGAHHAASVPGFHTPVSADTTLVDVEMPRSLPMESMMPLMTMEEPPEMAYSLSTDSLQPGSIGTIPTSWSQVEAPFMEPSFSQSQASGTSGQVNSPVSMASFDDQVAPFSGKDCGVAFFAVPMIPQDSDQFHPSSFAAGVPYPQGSDLSVPGFGQGHGYNHFMGPFPGQDSKIDFDNANARSHEFYRRAPDSATNLYHCPYAPRDCKHEPQKLKCNYDKHLDSHLKPYRCKFVQCQGTPFSSTACLLRHEREAHHMHGHGDCPYSCDYENCDRRIHGFRRHFNKMDHMKRVHNHQGSRRGSQESASRSEGATPRARGRRRASEDSHGSSANKVARAPRARASGKQRPTLHRDTQSQPDILGQAMKCTQPQTTVNPAELVFHVHSDGAMS